MTVNPSSLDLPQSSGVYIFKTKEGEVLYVGKATNIRQRVRSYFSPNPDRAMIPTLVSRSDDVDFIITSGPREALVLEKQLIRKHKPRYNSAFKDDKSYPYIAITGHEEPRILYTRRPPSGSKVWGPFPDAGAAKGVIKLLRRQFGIRDNKGALPFGYNESDEIHDYGNRIRMAIGVLDGDARLVVEDLQERMDLAADSLQYELAAQYRDKIGIVQKTISNQVIKSRFYTEIHAVGFASRQDFGQAAIIQAEEGVIQGQVNYPMIHRGSISESISLLLSEHYSNQKPPRILLVPTGLEEGVMQWLSDKRGSKVEIRVPKRGKLSKLRALADRNAEIQLERSLSRSSGNIEYRAASDSAKLLGLDKLEYVVCFDMAQLLGGDRVGASVVFRNGKPEKSEYRTYRVKGGSMDDLGMMSEVVQRWVLRLEHYPDLVILDGGKTHLTTIVGMLEDMGYGDKFPVIALAKKEETVYTTDGRELLMDRRGRMIIHARDEAHRFVNSYHRKRRSKGTLKNPLEHVDGLGAKKIQTLLRYFGGMQQIRHASQDELSAIPGIGPELARRIVESFRRS